MGLNGAMLRGRRTPAYFMPAKSSLLVATLPWVLVFVALFAISLMFWRLNVIWQLDLLFPANWHFAILRPPAESNVLFGSVPQLLTVCVVSLAGFSAIKQFGHHQGSARAAANAAVIRLFETYLSVEYQTKVRRVAWQALRKARADSNYHADLLAALAGAYSGNEVQNAYERKRYNPGEPYQEGEERELAFHEEYHRVQDILGFFTILSVLADNRDSNKADPSVIGVCHFFYDRWRAPLHGIIRDLGEYSIPLDDPELNIHPSSDILKTRRYMGYLDVLKKLDAIFQLKNVDWRNDPLAQNEFASQGGRGRRPKPISSRRV